VRVEASRYLSKGIRAGAGVRREAGREAHGWARVFWT